jgi:hypothetical protein
LGRETVSNGPQGVKLVTILAINPALSSAVILIAYIPPDIIKLIKERWGR